MKCFTDYPHLHDDKVIREVTVLTYDRNKYCSVMYHEKGNLHYTNIKRGYLYVIDKDNRRVTVSVKKLLTLPSYEDAPKPTRKQTAVEIKKYIRYKKEYSNVNYFITSFGIDGSYMHFKECKQVGKAIAILRKLVNISYINSVEVERGNTKLLYYNKATKVTITRKHFNIKKLFKQNGLLHL